MDLRPDEVLDCSGLACPLPILKTRRAIDGLQVGQILKMISTDLGTAVDVYAWARKTGHEVIHREDDSDSYIFYILKTR
jgi:tRNA 2-thiouridine synthesizing protein A